MSVAAIACRSRDCVPTCPACSMFPQANDDDAKGCHNHVQRRKTTPMKAVPSPVIVEEIRAEDLMIR
jgi:hypothetical protein